MSPDDQRSTPLLQVVITDEEGRGVRKPSLARWLQGIAPRRARGTMSVALVPDRVMRRINRDFARHDYATDVLSFPADEHVRTSERPNVRTSKRTPDSRILGPSDFRTTARHLGDIVIATGVAARQAAEAGHPLNTELRVLALHGLLHLLGYDHASDTGQMARLEARLRAKGGMREGLIERAAPRGSSGPRRQPRAVGSEPTARGARPGSKRRRGGTAR